MEGKWNGKFQKIIEIEMWNGIGVEKEWNRKGKKTNQIYWSQYQVEWNRIGMEMEWKINEQPWWK